MCSDYTSNGKIYISISNSVLINDQSSSYIFFQTDDADLNQLVRKNAVNDRRHIRSNNL